MSQIIHVQRIRSANVSLVIDIAPFKLHAIISWMGKSKGASLETVLKAVVSLQEQVAELPTKTVVERIVEEAFKTNEQLKKIDEIVKEIKVVSRAVDKDAETLVKHERRITRVEQRLAIK